MSDSGSESSSSEEFEEGRRSATPDTVASRSPRRSPNSDRKSPSTEASYQARSPGSPSSGRESKSPRSTAVSVKSPGYDRSSAKSVRSPSNSPMSSGSSQKSRSPSPRTYRHNETAESPRSNRSSPSKSNPGSPQPTSNRSSPQNRSNRSSTSRPGSNRSSPQPASPGSPRPSSNRSSSRPRSNRSSPQSPDNCRFERSGPMSPKSPRMRDYVSGPASPTSQTGDCVSGPASPTYRDHSPKSPLDRHSESRPSSPKSPMSPRSPRSPRSPSPVSRRSSAKSPGSIRNSPKSPRSPIDDRHSRKRSPPHSPEDNRNSSYNELDGEQISDGDMDDVSQSAIKSKLTPITHGEDLSDVSDLDSMEDDVEREQMRKKTEEKVEQVQNAVSEKREREEKIVPVSMTEENEQLDFEADGQWKDEREDGETDPAPVKEAKEVKDKDPTDKDKDKAKGKDAGELNDKEEGEEDGEKVESELEEGELSDGEEARPEETEPRPVCRFYNRGQCTWGVSCRFLHPGVTDKGNYTMFDMVRPMAYPPHAGAAHEFRPHIERPSLMRPLPGFAAPPHAPKVEDLASESPWERGLRQAKEMMRKANKRKESDMDFEEKKMNLSLGQEELDREAGYYVRPASPEPPVERWPPREAPAPRVSRTAAPRITPDHFVDEPEGFYPPTPHEYYRRVQYKSESRGGMEYRERYDYHSIPARTNPHSSSPQPHPRERERERERDRHGERDREREREYYEKYEKKHKRPSREVIVERIPSSKTYREEEPPPVERGRGDEWADPWMRRKSPGSVRRSRPSPRRSRRQSYSSGSSYSSSSSSRSSSHSSYTSYDSQSRSRSPSPPSRSRVNAKTKAPTTPPTATAPPIRGAMLMNPPAPSPRGTKGAVSPTGTLHRRAGLNPPAPSPLTAHPRHNDKTRDKAALAAAAVAKVIKSHSRSSSSGSDSSGSSSDSSESSYSSSSSETRKKKGSTPPVRKDSKALDALKVSGTKQQIKLTLKPTATAVKKIDRSTTIAGKKRPAESPPMSDSKASVAAAAAKAAKKASSRREELLKQLKAVEDAIARKRSKV